MKRFLVLWLALVAQATQAQRLITLDEAIAMARRHTASAGQRVELDSLRRTMRLPDLRIESNGNASRNLELFSEGPFESQSTSAVIAADWDLYDGGARRARLDAVEAHLAASGGESDEAVVSAVVNSYAALLSAREQRALLDGSDLPTDAAVAIDAALAAGEITAVDAAERRDVVLSLRTRSLDAAARELDAVATLRELTGIEDDAFVVQRGVPSAATPAAADARLAEFTARVREAEARQKPRVTFSGYSGVGAARSTFRSEESSGSFGIYGVRIGVSFPLFDWNSRLQLAEARGNEQSVRRTLLIEGEQRTSRVAALRRGATAAAQRVSLLEESLAAARQRSESVQRLVDAGLRTKGDALRVRADVVLRESDLAAARMEEWRLRTLADAMTAGTP